MDPCYFYVRNGTRIIGPFSSARLLDARHAGRLRPDDLVSGDKVAWTRAGDLAWLEWGPSPAPAGAPEIRLGAFPPSPGGTIRMGTPPVAAAPIPAANRAGDRTGGGIPVPPDGGADGAGGDADLWNDGPDGRLAGDTLSLFWNTTDNLLRLVARDDRARTVCAFVALAASLACSAGLIPLLTPALRNGSGVGWGAAVAAGGLPVLWGMLAGIRVVWGDPFASGRWSSDLVVAAAAQLNLAGGAVLMFAFRRNPAAAIAIWSFFGVNLTTALRIGLIRFDGIAPRHAVWLTAGVLSVLAAGVWGLFVI